MAQIKKSNIWAYMKSKFSNTASHIKMNGTQSAGTSDLMARADHVHPSDTSRAPVSHTHTQLETTASIPGGSDLNDYTTNGRYKCSRSNSETLSNKPFSGLYAFILEVVPYDDLSIIQKLTMISTTQTASDIYYRIFYNGTTWVAWRKITTDDEDVFIKNDVGTVTSNNILNNTIVNDDIADATITGSKLVNGTITATQLEETVKNTAYINLTEIGNGSEPTDLNDISSIGRYFCGYNNIGNLENAPWDSPNALLLEVHSTGGTFVQIAYKLAKSVEHSLIFYRIGNNAGWGLWHQITRLRDIPTNTSQLVNDGDGTNLFVKNNDSRLTDARTPKSHAHGIITNNGYITTGESYQQLITDDTGKIIARDMIRTADFDKAGTVKIFDEYDWSNVDTSQWRQHWQSSVPLTNTLYGLYDYICWGNDSGEISTFVNGWSGTVKYFVKNGWCMVYFEGLTRSTVTQDPITICELPEYTACGNDKIYAPTNLGDIIVRVRGKYLEGRCLNTGQELYGQITYPIPYHRYTPLSE